MTDLNKLLSPIFLEEKEIRKLMELLFFSYRDFTAGPDEILKKIRNKSIKNNIDPKITIRIWKSIIWSYVDFQRRNFKKK